MAWRVLYQEKVVAERGRVEACCGGLVSGREYLVTIESRDSAPCCDRWLGSVIENPGQVEFRHILPKFCPECGRKL
ncbi:MAG: hypothetical protein WC565_08430 [Parcubacteria group bacterium]